MALPINVFDVDTPDGPRHYVSCLSHEQVFANGLPPEAIIGVLLRPWDPSQPIMPEVFARNRVFVEFMHEVIGRRGPMLDGLRAEARRQQEGWVYIVDRRTLTPGGSVPPEDIVGAFEVKHGQVVPGTYQASPKHVILSSGGFFQFGTELEACLLEELAKCASAP